MMKFYKLLATAGGAGYSPVAPGTTGTIVGCAIYYLLSVYTDMSNLHFFILVTITFGLGTLASHKLEPQWGKDPQRIVIDEVVGVWIALLFVPFHWVYIVLAFVLFRFLDITKILGIRKFEPLPKGFGVMMDDVIAGIYSNVIMQILIFSKILRFE